MHTTAMHTIATTDLATAADRTFERTRGARAMIADMDEPDAHAAETDAEPPSPGVVATLVAHHRDFLAYVQRRVGDRALAEEILQEAFVRSLDKGDEVRESAIGWFYRLLRNAIIDHQRRRAVAARRLDAYAQEQDEAPADDELHQAVCRCVAELAGTLKPEYAAALRRIEVDGISVKDYASEVGISPSNAGVRVFRAREALRRQVARACGTCADHGCLDCTCDAAPAPAPGHGHAHAHGPGHGCH